MDRINAIVSRYFNTSAGELLLGGLPVSAIVAQYGTPLFIYDSHILDRKWQVMRHTLPSEFAISYSVKANPNPSILKHFLAKGCGLEVASGGEFHLALSAGCPPQKMLFAGPGKTETELQYVLARDIGEIHVESLLEAERVGAISRCLPVQARVAVRVNASGDAQGGAMRMGGKAAPFGIDEERLDVVLDYLLSEPSIQFLGIHLFTGTQILDPTILIRQYRKGLEIARGIAHRLQHPLHTVDFGGGFGIPYFAHEQELDMKQLREELALLMAEIRCESLFDGTQFMVEPGRYLVGEAGIYVTRINDIKVSRGKKFLVVDGGMHHHLAASGNLGQLIKRNFPVVLLNKLEETSDEVIDIVGPLCTPLDVLARDVQLPSADIGDLVGVMQSGAYARAASPLGFLSHPTPAEVLIYNGEVRLIRRRGTYDDLLHDIP
jgi:diaminopimelate decarboxylase